MRLHYLQTKDGREIDFFILKEDLPLMMLEVKWADASLSRNFSLFDRFIKGCSKIQIVAELDREKTFPGRMEIRQAHGWLADVDLGTDARQALQAGNIE